MLIKVDDIVEVITGDDRGTTAQPVRGKVLKVDRTKGKVVVEGINRVFKHMRKSQKNPQGGRLSKEMAVSISNVMFVCPQTGKRTRLGVRVAADGSKERFCKVSGASAGVIAPPKGEAAAKPTKKPKQKKS